MNLLQIYEPGQTPLPHADVVAVGIDLGTTHSVVAISDQGKVEILHDAAGVALQPSVVHYAGEQINVGLSAKAEADKGNPNAVASIKRQMDQASTRLDVGGKALTPVEISADILRHMKRIAETDLGKPVNKAVITVPAYFDDTARLATKDAARLAGLEVLRLVNEPTAAALAYGLDKGAEGIYAIYDLGGGTFDISILKMEKGVFQVLSTAGDTKLGGDDFDTLLAEKFAITNAQAREAKEILSAKDKTENITRVAFEQLIAPLVDKTITICNKALTDAKIAKDAVKGVVLVGGSTRVPLVRAKVEQFFGSKPLTDVNPDEVVAVGAALQAEGLTAGSDNLLLDVIPLSLGLETMGGLTEKLIQRNTPIPVSVAQEFTTYQDNQTGMQIHVVQGEREMVHDNRSLARFELVGIPALPAGIARVKVTFAVDADGLLTVSAEEMTTGTKQTVAVKPSYGLSAEEMEAMLLKSMENARADITERLMVEAKVEAERIVIELESAMKQDGELLNEAEKKLIALQIKYVREAVAEGDRDRIDIELQQLSQNASNFAQKRMDKAIGHALKGVEITKL